MGKDADLVESAVLTHIYRICFGIKAINSLQIVFLLL
jgi:hypothetical protein